MLNDSDFFENPKDIQVELAKVNENMCGVFIIHTKIIYRPNKKYILIKFYIMNHFKINKAVVLPLGCGIADCNWSYWR